MTQNPLLANTNKIPGKTFTLPSRGVFYKNGELDESVTAGEVHIFPLSGFTELHLKNPDLLFNGKAIIRVFSECVPEIKKPLELASKDVEAILFYLRMVTYGSEFRIELKHECPDSKTHGYSVNLESVLANSTNLDPTMIGEYTMPIEVAGMKVYTRPVRFVDVVELFHATGTKKEFSEEDIERIARKNVLSMISSVEDVTNPEHIEGWLETLTTPQLNLISDAAESKTAWGINNITKIKCKDCGEIIDVELPLNPINFFSS